MVKFLSDHEIRDLIEKWQGAWSRQHQEKNKVEMDAVRFRWEEIMPRMRKATPEDYKAWLRGYISSGGQLDFSLWGTPMPDDFYVAQMPFRLVPLSGILHMHIIVPEGVSFLGGELGGCELYFMEGFRADVGYGKPAVHIFSDTRF